MSALSNILDAMNQASLTIPEIAAFSTNELSQLGALHDLIVRMDSRLEESFPEAKRIEELRRAILEDFSKAPLLDARQQCDIGIKGPSPEAVEAFREADEKLPPVEVKEEAQAQPVKFPCPQCGKICANKAGLSSHIRIGHAPKKQPVEPPTVEVEEAVEIAVVLPETAVGVPNEHVTAYAKNIRKNPF